MMSRENKGGWLLKQKKKFYQQNWFIMFLLFSPLFPIGLYLMWREKDFHIAGKIFMTLVWIYAIVYTLQTPKVLFLNKTIDEITPSSSSDVTAIVSFIDENKEKGFGKFYDAKKKNSNPEKDFSIYKVSTSSGEYQFHLHDHKVISVYDINNKEIFHNGRFVSNKGKKEIALPEYQVVYKEKNDDKKIYWGEVVVPSYSSTTPKDVLIQTAKEIAEKEGFTHVYLSSSKEAPKAVDSSFDKEKYPYAIEEEYLGCWDNQKGVLLTPKDKKRE
jgi:hypothetical protein